MKKHISEVEDHLYLPILTTFANLACEFEELERRAEETAYEINILALEMDKIKKEEQLQKKKLKT